MIIALTKKTEDIIMVKIIIDTDIGSDCDDAGALALAHNLANEGKCQILAVTNCLSRKKRSGRY